MDHALDLPAFGILAKRVGIVGAAQFGHIALCILDRLVGTDHVASAQAHLTIGLQTLEALRRAFLVITCVDIDLPGKRQLTHTHVLLWMTRQLQILDLTFRIVGNHHLQRLEHAHRTWRIGVQVFADANSSIPTSTTPPARLTPIMSQKARIEEGV